MIGKSVLSFLISSALFLMIVPTSQAHLLRAAHTHAVNIRKLQETPPTSKPTTTSVSTTKSAAATTTTSQATTASTITNPNTSENTGASGSTVPEENGANLFTLGSAASLLLAIMTSF